MFCRVAVCGGIGTLTGMTPRAVHIQWISVWASHKQLLFGDPFVKHLTFGGNSFEVYERFKKNLDHLEDPYRQASTMPLLLSSQDSPRVFDSDRHWNSMILRRAWHTHWDKALVVDDPHMAVVHPSPLDPAPQHPQHLASSPRVVHQV